MGRISWACLVTGLVVAIASCDGSGSPGAGGSVGGSPLPLPAPEPRLATRSGPGLGNLEYQPSELFEALARVDTSNAIPDDAPLKPYGTNVATMVDGWFFTIFAPDSGNGPGGFLFYDLANPRAPKLVKRLYEPHGSTGELREAHSIGLGIVNDRTYAAIQSRLGLQLWDLSNVQEPRMAGFLRLPQVNGGDYTFVA